MKNLRKSFWLSATLIMIVALNLLPSCGLKSNLDLPEGKYKFYGVIDSNENIEMDLDVNREGKIDGSYTTDKGGTHKSFNIRGSVFDKNKVTLYVTGGAGGETIQTFNVFAEKGEGNVITMKGTINDNVQQKVYNVVLANSQSMLNDIKAPSVPAKKDEASKIKKPAKHDWDDEEEDTRIVNNSPYPIAPGSHSFSGKAEGQYPIVMYLTVSSNGNVTGKMAYKSTLKKYGDKDKNYMKLYGSFRGNSLKMTGEYDDGNVEDWTLDCSDNGKRYKLDGWAFNYNRDKSFSIVVTGK